jgi:hypothetical protein
LSSGESCARNLSHSEPLSAPKLIGSSMVTPSISGILPRRPAIRAASGFHSIVSLIFTDSTYNGGKLVATHLPRSAPGKGRLPVFQFGNWNLASHSLSPLKNRPRFMVHTPGPTSKKCLSIPHRLPDGSFAEIKRPDRTHGG